LTSQQVDKLTSYLITKQNKKAINFSLVAFFIVQT